MYGQLLNALTKRGDDELVAAFGPDMALIEDIIARELADEHGGRLEGPRRKRLIQSLFRSTARKALTREVAFLGESLATEIRDMPALVTHHINALSRLGATSVLRNRLAQCGAQHIHPNVAAAAARARVLHCLHRGAPDHEAYWGTIPDSLDDALAGLAGRTETRLAVTKQIKALCDRRQIPEPQRDDFQQRFAHGVAMRSYLHFLRSYREHVLRENLTLDVVDRRMLSLAEQALARRGEPDMAEPLADRSAGRSVLVAYAHQGVLRADEDLPPLLQMPLTVIANDGRRFAQSADAIIVNVQSKDATTAFLRAAKAGRRGPRLVLIHPDGRNGECAIRQVLGRPFRIGLGAAFLGWTARAQTYFQRNAWRDGCQHTELARGPCADNFGNREAFTAAFLNFYAGEIERILLGPPQDIGNRLLF